MSFLRTNYRITGGVQPSLGVFNSALVVLSLADVRTSLSMNGDAQTCSMAGYGYPRWVGVIGMSAGGRSASLPIVAKFSQDFSGSIAWLHVLQSDSNLTGTAQVQFLALIGSR